LEDVLDSYLREYLIMSLLNLKYTRLAYRLYHYHFQTLLQINPNFWNSFSIIPIAEYFHHKIFIIHQYELQLRSIYNLHFDF